MLRALITQSIKIFLEDGVGPKTGLVPADFSGGNIFIYKADGTKITLPLVALSNFIEEDSTDAPGSYSFIITGTDLDQEGYYTFSFQPAAAAFKSQLYKDYVSNVPSQISQLSVDMATVIAVLPATTIAAYTDIIASEANIRGVDSRDLSVMAGAGFAPTDSLVAIKAAISSSPSSTWEELLTSHNNLNTFGELLNILYAVLLNRIKIDTTLNKMFLYKADNTLLKTYDLFDPNGFPSGVNVTERAKAV
jgi:hypothetical protein